MSPQAIDPQALGLCLLAFGFGAIAIGAALGYFPGRPGR
jgi:hypothetical protein